MATLSHEMDWLFIPEIRAKNETGTWAPRNEIAQNFRAKYPEGTLEFWLRTDEPYLCDIIYKMEDGKRSYVFANPYTGKIQGEAQITFQRFFRDLHYFLFIPFQIGHFTVLIFGFLLLISLITALVFYKKWWRKLFELQTGKGPLVFFRSFHRLVGLWSVPFTLLFAVTGIWYFLERTNVGGISTVSNPKNVKITASKEQKIDSLNTYDPNTFDYTKASAVAMKAIPGLQVGDILPPKSQNTAVYITGKSDVPLVRQRANRVYLDPVTYELLKDQKATEINTVVWLNDIAAPLHFGNWGGLITKFIWFILGAGITGLVLSGIWITAKRKALKRKKNNKKIMGAWWYVNWSLYAVMLFFMYYFLLVRYQASTIAVIGISAGWGIFILLSWYLFVFRLKRVVKG